MNNLIKNLAISLFVFAGYIYCTRSYDFDSKRTGLIKVPVADFFLPYKELKEGAVNLDNFEFPISYGEKINEGRDLFRYGRVYQGLFNEIVFNIDCFDKICFGDLPGVWYGFEKDRSMIRYAFSKKDIVLFSNISANVEFSKFIPRPIIFGKNFGEVVTLIQPWEDSISGRKYSVGTRFVKLPNLNNLDNKQPVLFYDFRKKVLLKSFIPEEFLINVAKNKGVLHAADRKKLFVSIIRNWIDSAKENNGIIPYLFGGNSFDGPYIDKGFDLVEEDLLGEKRSVFKRRGKKVASGFDCSSLVFRAARIAGFPFYVFKHTTLLPKFLKPFNSVDDSLEQGDLIWISGHVMIVGDIEKNMLIEAVGYASGFGRVHEIELRKRFYQVESYKKLLRLAEEKKSLWLLSKNGEKIEFCPKFKILKLEVQPHKKNEIKNAISLKKNLI